MSKEAAKKGMAPYGTRIGRIIGKELRNFELNFFKEYAFLPELVLHFGSYVVKRKFTRQTSTSAIKDSICFLFYNIFEDNTLTTGRRKVKRPEETPYVRVFPFALSQKISFTKNTQVTHVLISISADYLKSFLKEDAKYFQFLFDSSNNFLMEEIMTDDIFHTINDIMKKEAPNALKSYHYKLKAMELIFYLFQSLGKRERTAHHKLSEGDIKSIYKVRDKLVSSLQHPVSIAELKQIAGMNELKMRKLFTQVFGRGIYDYYQHLRMKEAARLLRDEKLSVSEAGYQMGFENLSHFSRVFEKHIGKKPKKYSRELIGAVWQ